MLVVPPVPTNCTFPSFDSRRIAGSDELDDAGLGFAPERRFKLRANRFIQKFFQPRAARGQLAGGWRIAGRKFFQEPHRAEGITFGEMLLPAPAQNEFRAAATDVNQEQRLLRQFWIGGHALKCPCGLLFAGNDFHLQARYGLDGVRQILRIRGVPRGAGGDDPDGGCLVASRRTRKHGNRLRGLRDGIRLEPVGIIKPLAQARLDAALPDWLDVRHRDIGHQQFYGVGANVNDSTADWFHRAAC